MVNGCEDWVCDPCHDHVMVKNLRGSKQNPVFSAACDTEDDVVYQLAVLLDEKRFLIPLVTLLFSIAIPVAMS